MKDARDDAKEFLSDNFLEEIVEQLIESGEASDDINNDYPNGDGLFHESIVDEWYSPSEAVEILEEYDDHEETDSGLWEGLNDWKRILGTIAAFTYGNAVMSEINDLFEEINRIDVDEIRDELLEPFKKAWEQEDEFLKAEGRENELLEYDPEIYDEDIKDELKARVESAVNEILGY